MTFTLKVDCDACGKRGLRLVATGHGFTNGDKWSCEFCGSFVVVGAGRIPQTEKKSEDRNP